MCREKERVIERERAMLTKKQTDRTRLHIVFHCVS